ncbi:Slp family lipoprotein [Paraglaciecola chathamensis]|uniref:Slp family lipoprotein n=1 Tax=Paraglaciecola chathamensis TaxID=368405 RepID=UPI002704C134|nr:Slp family lipoprotein [Paraglaciecola chathamensis]MDO6839765.1 Slp family lipoprotein [Paraglaciecola chathamensis]
MYTKIGFLFVTMWLAGCSTLPEQIQLPEQTNLITYQEAASKSKDVLGQKARWGGVIARVENKPNDTLIEMVYYPLRSYGRPLQSDESIGRFRVYVNGFLDPMVYKKGRTMTFTGDFVRLEKGMVGEHEYVFPTLASSGYYLWKEIQQVDVNMISVWPYDYWRYGWYNRPFHNRLFIRNTHRTRSSPAKLKSSAKTKSN